MQTKTLLTTLAAGAALTALRYICVADGAADWTNSRSDTTSGPHDATTLAAAMGAAEAAYDAATPTTTSNYEGEWFSSVGRNDTTDYQDAEIQSRYPEHEYVLPSGYTVDIHQPCILRVTDPRWGGTGLTETVVLDYSIMSGASINADEWIIGDTLTAQSGTATMALFTDTRPPSVPGPLAVDDAETRGFVVLPYMVLDFHRPGGFEYYA